MIDISGHLRDTRREIGFEDFSIPLMINCCGYQAFTEEDFSKHRPKGRLDYQLIYLYRGYGEYLIDGNWKRMGPGSVIVYRPSEPQIYTYHGRDLPEIYWIHFTGTGCEQFLCKYQLETSIIGENLQLKNMFQEIILELQLKKSYFEEVITSNFHKIAAVIARITTQKNAVPESDFALDRLIIQLNQSYMENWSVASMAEFCNLSEDYFAHSFKQAAKLAPMQYLTQLRVDKAKDLLLWKEINISTVASLVGYEDPLYFSRVFKKSTGNSPKAYRKNQLL